MESNIKDTESMHKLALGFADEYLDATENMRDRAEKARDYFDGYQWTEREVRILENRGQPAITINRIKPKVQFLKGMETQNRTDPKALPRTPGDDNSAQVSTDALRYIEERNDSDRRFSDGFENYIIEGVEGHEVIIDRPKIKAENPMTGERITYVSGLWFDRFGSILGKQLPVGFNPLGLHLEVKHNRIPWDRLFYDPHSREKNFSDATYLGTLQWMDRQQAKDDFPNAPSDFWDFNESCLHSDEETFDDRPLYYIDEKRDRIRVFYCYFIHKNIWHYTVYSAGGFAIPPMPSPYLNDDGEPEPQFVFQAAFVDRDGNRYGEVESYLDIQDEINKRRSKFMHLLSVRQTWGNKGAVVDIKEHKKQMSKPDGHLEFLNGEWGKDFGIVPTNDMANGQLTLLTEAKSEIDVQGANSVLQGNVPQPLSGRAVQSLQQGGVVDLGSLFDGHRECKCRVYRMMFNRIKQFWTEEKWIRVLGDDSKIKWTGLNRRLTVRDLLIEQGIPESELPKGDPRLEQPAIVNGKPVIQNPVNKLDMDIMIDESTDTVSLQAEQFDLLARMYQANPNAIDFKLLIKASQLRNKDELIRMLEGGTDEQQKALVEARQKEQAELKQLAMMSEAAKIEKDRASAQKDIASANKIMNESNQVQVNTAIDIEQATNPVNE